MSIKIIFDILASGLEEGYFALCCVTLLKVRFGINGPWTPKSSHCHRWSRPDSIRRRGFDQGIFPAHPLAGCTLAACAIRSAQQPLQYQRISGSVAVPAD